MRRPGCFLSENGKNVVKYRRQEKGYKYNANFCHEVLISACKYIDPSKEFKTSDTLYLEGINPASWKKFQGGNPKQTVHPKIFAAYCYALELDWNEVIDQTCVNVYNLLYLIPKTKKLSDDVDRSAFVRDVTYPDGTILNINEKFIKVWEIQNIGKVTWKNRFLTRIDDNLGIVSIRSPKRTEIPLTKPGEIVSISVPLQAPPLPTHTKATWKMTFSNNKTDFCFPNKYNCGIVVEITVIE